MLKILRDRNAGLYLLGTSVSTFGDRALFLALAIWAQSLSGSASAAGAIFAIMAVTSLLAPFSGVVVDRWPRRRVLLVTNLIGVVVVLPLLLVHGSAQLFVLYVVAFLYGLIGDVSGAAESALYTDLVPSDLLADMNGATQTISESLRIVTPLVGAGLYAAVGGHIVALVDAATFIVAAAAVQMLELSEADHSLAHGRSAADLEAEAAKGRAARLVSTVWRNSSAGVRYLWATAALRQLYTAFAATLLVVGFLETLGFDVVTIGLHRSAAFIGVPLTFQGVGAIFGGLTSARLLKRIGERMLTALGIGCITCGVALLLVPELVAVVAGMVVAGIGVPWVIVAVMTKTQRSTPAHLQGRVAAAAGAVLGLPQTISISLGAVLVSVIDYRILLVVVAVVSLAAAVWLATRSDPVEEAAGPGRAEQEAEVGGAT